MCKGNRCFTEKSLHCLARMGTTYVEKLPSPMLCVRALRSGVRNLYQIHLSLLGKGYALRFAECAYETIDSYRSFYKGYAHTGEVWDI